MGRTFAGIPDGLRGAFATPDLRRLQVASVASCTGGWAFMVGAVGLRLRRGRGDRGRAGGVRADAAGRPGGAVRRPRRRPPLAARRARRVVRRASGRARRDRRARAGRRAAGRRARRSPRSSPSCRAPSARPRRRCSTLLARTPQELAAANAAWSGLDNASFLVGALLGGALIAATGTTVVFAVTAALFVVATRRARPGAARPRSAVPRRHRRGARRPAARPRRLRRPARRARRPGARARRRHGRGDDVRGGHRRRARRRGRADDPAPRRGRRGLAQRGVGRGRAGRRRGGARAAAPRAAVRAGWRSARCSPARRCSASRRCRRRPPRSALLVAFGIGYALVDVAELTLVQRLASDELLARAFGVTETLYWITTALGAALAPLLIAWLGVRGALAVSGAGLLVLVAVPRPPAGPPGRGARAARSRRQLRRARPGVLKAPFVMTGQNGYRPVR